MQQLWCKKCESPITAENINLDRLIAKCSNCHTVFSFAGSFEMPVAEPGIGRGKTMAVAMPKSFELENDEMVLRISHRWFSPKIIAMTFFALFWNGFMLVWYGIALALQLWPMALFGLLHAAVGLGAIYYVVAGYLNRTRVEVASPNLTITHGPVPYPGKRLERDAIKQLYCKEKISRGKNSSTITYELHAITQDDKHETLLTGLDECEQALYLEQEIERYLMIEDRPVRGEFGR